MQKYQGGGDAFMCEARRKYRPERIKLSAPHPRYSPSLMWASLDLTTPTSGPFSIFEKLSNTNKKFDSVHY
jgi:hypothetical protein